MMNHYSNIVLAAGMTVAIMTLTAGSASAAGNAKMMTRENVGTRVQGLSVQPKPQGISMNPGTVKGISLPPGKVTGIVKPPKKPPIITGIVKPPIITGIVKPPIITGIVKPPKGIVITGIVKPPKPPIIIPPVVVNPPDVVPVPVPGEATYIERRYPWYTGGGMATAKPVMNTARPVMNTAEAPCTCLTKEYLEDGSVLFKDVCTKEAAILTVEEMRNKARGANLQNQ